MKDRRKRTRPDLPGISRNTDRHIKSAVSRLKKRVLAEVRG